MAEILLRLSDAAAVEVVLQDLPRGPQSELEYTLMQAGATPSHHGFRIAAFAFRRHAVELSNLIRRTGAAVNIDAGTQALLEVQLNEIQARRGAALVVPWSFEDVEAAVRATGRFVRALTERQLVNLGQLLALRHGANFSVPGAGKTTTLLAVYEALRGIAGNERLLVVAPKNAFLSWEQEVATCYSAARLPVVSRLRGGRRGVAEALRRDSEIYLITYQLLPNVIDLIKSWARRFRTHITLDESHRAKAGYTGVYSSASLELAEVSVRRDILSGTPLPHAPEDLRPQLDFLWPGHRILPDLRLLADSPSELIEDVERRVRPLYVRTTKQQLDLPPLQLYPRSVELGPLQRELYEVLRSEAARAASGMGARDRQFFRVLGRHVIRLIQAAANPMLLTQGQVVDRVEVEPSPQGARAWELLRELARFEQPAKIAIAIELAEESIASGDRVLIWSSFILNLHSLARLLAHHNPVLLYGEIPTGDADDADTREGRIRRFHEDPNCRVMIANPAAAGEGISLHRACHHAIYLDRTFNAAHYLQSIDRIHRLGSEVPARVDVLEARGTIDARIAERLRIKIEAMARILNDEGLRALAYDPADIIEEIDGGIEADDLEEIIDHLGGSEGSD